MLHVSAAPLLNLHAGPAINLATSQVQAAELGSGKMSGHSLSSVVL